MKLERTITVEESRSTLEARTIAYLEQAGYKQVSSQTSIIYRRGSIFGTWLSFSPKSWQVQATTQIVSSEKTSDVSIKFDVNSTGQLITEKERNFWNTELDGLEVAIRSGNIDIKTSISQAQSSRSQNRLTSAIIMIVMVVFGMVGRVILGTRLGLLVGAALGAVTGFLIAGRWQKYKIR